VSLVAPKHRGVALRILEDTGATAARLGSAANSSPCSCWEPSPHSACSSSGSYWLAFGAFTGLSPSSRLRTLLSTILPALFVVGTGNWLQVTAVLALGVVVHLIEANLVSPFIMERKVALPPVLTIASVLVMGTLLGVIGLVVAVPILAVTMVVIRTSCRARFTADTVHVEPAVLRVSGQFRVPKATTSSS